MTAAVIALLVSCFAAGFSLGATVVNLNWIRGMAKIPRPPEPPEAA